MRDRGGTGGASASDFGVPDVFGPGDEEIFAFLRGEGSSGGSLGGVEEIGLRERFVVGQKRGEILAVEIRGRRIVGVVEEIWTQEGPISHERRGDGLRVDVPPREIGRDEEGQAIDRVGEGSELLDERPS